MCAFASLVLNLDLGMCKSAETKSETRGKDTAIELVVFLVYHKTTISSSSFLLAIFCYTPISLPVLCVSLARTSVKYHC